MQADEREDGAGDDEDVQREEARQRLARDDRAGEHHVHRFGPISGTRPIIAAPMPSPQ